MESKFKIKKDNIIAFLMWFLISIIVLINNEIFENSSEIIVMTFLLFEILISFFPKEIRRALPMIIIQITGFIRYVMIPIAIKNEIRGYSNRVIEIMILELAAIYFGIAIYFLKNNKKKISEKMLNINESVNQKIGLSSIITILLGGTFVLMNKAYIERYLSFSTNKTVINDVSGGINLLVAVFFLIVFIKGIEFIYKLPLKNEIIKVVLSIIISAFYINGSSITSFNVSRWSMIITSIIAFTYIARLYPNYKMKLNIFLVGCIVFAVSVGSLIKFANYINGYNNLQNVFKEQLKYKTLNAYFAGNKNMEIALDLNDDINVLNMSKIQIIISDLFANFPILNKYLSDPQIQTTVMYNYKYYNSTIACDQIIPYSTQLYIFLKYFFVIFESIQIYYAFKLYYKMKEEDDFLKIYNLIYLIISFSLVNCISLSVILQNIWIHVLPVFVIYSLNIQIKNKKI